MRTERVRTAIEHGGGYRDAAPARADPRDDHEALQRALDVQFGVTPRERDELAAGCLPPRLRAQRRLRAMAWLCPAILGLLASLAVTACLERGARAWLVFVVALTAGVFVAAAAQWDELPVDAVREVRGPINSVLADGALWIAVGSTWFRSRWSSVGVLERGDVVRAYFTLPDREPLAVELIARADECAAILRADLDTTSEVTLDDFRARFH